MKCRPREQEGQLVGVDALIQDGLRMPMALYQMLASSRYVSVRVSHLGQLVLAISNSARQDLRDLAYESLRDIAWRYDYDSRAVFYYFCDPDEPRQKNPRRRKRNPIPHRGHVDFVGRDGPEHRVQLYRRGPRVVSWTVSYIGDGGALWYDEVSGRIIRDDTGDSIAVASVHRSEGDSELTARERRKADEDPVGYLAKRFGMPLFAILTEAIS